MFLTVGYSPEDLITTLFRVVKYYPGVAETDEKTGQEFPGMPEAAKLEYLKEIGFTHMRIVGGLATFLQLSGLLARLCLV